MQQGKIIQRFPEKDWEDTPFIEGMELVSEDDIDESQILLSSYSSFVNLKAGFYPQFKKSRNTLCPF